MALQPEQEARLEKAFRQGSGHGMLSLGADEVWTPLPLALSYWRELGARYIGKLCALPGIQQGEQKPAVPPPPESELTVMAAAIPPMTGAEYLTPAVLADLWRAMDTAW